MAYSQQPERAPHAVLDRGSRLKKAQKIAALIGEDTLANVERALEIGCGSGVITHALAQIIGDGKEVYGIDVVDSRTEMRGFQFKLVTGTSLPFPDSYFDLVISNHVIEHVGENCSQISHLMEIARVLKHSGTLYLAMPNRWRLMESHYRLPILSWLPRRLADIYVRTTRRGTHYDCRPLSYGALTRLFDNTGFHTRDVTTEALRITLDIEHKSNPIAHAASRALPNAFVRLVMPIMPTFVFLATTKKP